MLSYSTKKETKHSAKTTNYNGDIWQIMVYILKLIFQPFYDSFLFSVSCISLQITKAVLYQIVLKKRFQHFY